MNNNKYYTYKTVISILLTFVFFWLLIADSGFMKSLRQSLEGSVVSGQLVPARDSSQKMSTKITIVNIDERSLSAQGAWPWSGKQYTSLLNVLINNGASDIAFDLSIALKQQNSAAQVYNWIRKTRKVTPSTAQAMKRAIWHFDYINRLTSRLSNQEIVLGFEFISSNVPSIGFLPLPLEFRNKISLRGIPTASSYKGNLRQVQQTRLTGGFINLNHKGTYWYKTPALMRYGGQVYPSLSLQLARNNLLSKNIWLNSKVENSDHLTGLKLDETWIPTDKTGQVAVRFRGPPGTFPILSATDLMENRLTKGAIDKYIRNKTIIVSSDVGRIRPPVQIGKHQFSSGEVHANLLYGILNNQIFNRPSFLVNLDAYLLILTGLVLTLIFPGLNTRRSLVASLLAIVIWYTYHKVMLSIYMYISVLIVPLLMITSLWLLHFLANRESVKIRVMSFIQLVQNLVPLLSLNDKSKPEAEQISNQQTSVLFVQIRNFSALSDHLNPVELNKILKLFCNPITSLILRNRGQVTQYIGHTILATWPAQTSAQQAMDQTILTALKIQRISSALQAKLNKKGLPQLEVNIGVNSGVIKTSNLTWQSRLACGQVVDNALKLCGLCEFYGVRIIVSHNSLTPSDSFYFRQLDMVKLSGQNDKVGIYEPLCLVSDIDLCDYYELQLYERALEFLLEGNTQHATSFFQYLHKARPQTLVYERYLDEINQDPTLSLQSHKYGLLNKRALD